MLTNHASPDHQSYDRRSDEISLAEALLLQLAHSIGEPWLYSTY